MTEFGPMTTHRTIEYHDKPWDDRSDLEIKYKELEAKLQEAVEAALAYQKLSNCYRVGKQPTEKLFKELDKANKVLEETLRLRRSNET